MLAEADPQARSEEGQREGERCTKKCVLLSLDMRLKGSGVCGGGPSSLRLQKSQPVSALGSRKLEDFSEFEVSQDYL